MKKRKPKTQQFAEMIQYGHFYAPKAAISFILDLAEIKPHEVALSIGLLESDLKDRLSASVVLDLVGTEEIDKERLTALSYKSYDVILCAPSFGRIVGVSGEPEEELWLKWGLDHLTSAGRMIITVPMGLLSNVSQEPVRQYMLEHGTLETLVELPKGWAQGTTVPATILYLGSLANSVARPASRQVKMIRVQDQGNVDWAELSNISRSKQAGEKQATSIREFSIASTTLSSKRLDAKYYDPQFGISSPGPNFRETKLGDLVDIRSGEYFGATDFDAEGVLFVQVRNIGARGELDLNGARRVKAEKARNSRGFSEAGEILISTTGTVGKVALVPPQIDICIDVSLRRLRIKDRNQVLLPEYLLYYLLSDRAKLQFERWSSGTVISVLPTPNLEELIVYLPEFGHQLELVNTFENILQQRFDELTAAFPDIQGMSNLAKPSYPVPLPTEAATTETPTERSINEVVQLQFPFPIAWALRAYDISHDTSSVARIKKLITVSETIVYYIYSLFVADHLHRLKFSDSTLEQLLLGSLNDYSIDRRIKYILRFIRVCKDNPDTVPFVPELIIDEFGICSEIQNQVRNKYSHTDPSEAWCKQQITRFEPKLLALLHALIPLTQYRLVQINNITLRDDRIQHSIKVMMGDNPQFSTQVEDLDTLVRADTGHVVLLDQDYQALDLHPFYSVHAWESTGMQDHLCYLKQVTGQAPRQRMKLESTLGSGEAEVEIDASLRNQFGN